MKKLRTTISRACLFFLAVLSVLCFVTAAHADYEIDQITANVPTDGVTIVRHTEDVTIEWAKPAMTGGDVLQGFVYKWNTSMTPLNDELLNSENNDGIVSTSIDPPHVTQPAAFFANDDSDLIRYLHVKTWYLNASTNTISYSSDVVIGGINIDNVAPAGTVRIVDSNGNDITWTKSTSLNLRLSASKAPVKAYIGETSNRTQAQEVNYASEVVYALNNTDEGLKTIYVWYKDAAGNISSAASTKTVTLLGSVAIMPYVGTFDLSLEELVFIVDDGNNYDWTIETVEGVDVADFIGTSTAVDFVTVSFHNLGKFRLVATPAAGGDAISSGIYNIIEGSVSIEYTLVEDLNLIAFSVSGTGVTSASDLDAAITVANPGVSVSQIFGWDGANQSFALAYSNMGGGFTTGDFDLVEGAAYFVEVDNTGTFELTGQSYGSFQLFNGLNLLSIPGEISDTVNTASQFDDEIANKTGLFVSQVFGWDDTNQSFTLAYSNMGDGFTTGNFNLEIRKGYFVEVSGNGTYNP